MMKAKDVQDMEMIRNTPDLKLIRKMIGDTPMLYPITPQLGIYYGLHQHVIQTKYTGTVRSAMLSQTKKMRVLGTFILCAFNNGKQISLTDDDVNKFWKFYEEETLSV
jgi:hypothetical protein